MKTDATPEYRGVPFHVALETLTDPALVGAWREAMAARLHTLPQQITLGDPPRTVTLTDALRRAFHPRPRLEALMGDLRRKLRGGSLICAGRENGASLRPAIAFSVGDWERGGILSAQDQSTASAEIDGRLYGDLVFWRGVPMPPAAGWELPEASFALLPELDYLAWNSDFPGKALERLAPALLRAIVARDDLQITGRDFDAPPSVDRIVLSRDYSPGQLASNTFIYLDVIDSRITIRRPGRDFVLAAVRVEALPGPPAAAPQGGKSSPPREHRRGPRNPDRDGPIVERAAELIAASVVPATAFKRAHKELHVGNASNADITRYRRLWKAQTKTDE